jgi:HEAT repeat protein
MRRLHLKGILKVFAGIVITSPFSWAGASLDDMREMSVDDRRAFFRDINSVGLADSNDTLTVLIAGLSDPDDLVAENAAMACRWMMVGLQHLVRSGGEVPFDMSGLPDLQKLLGEMLFSGNPNARASAAEALAYSAAPNPEFDSLLVSAFHEETDVRVRVVIIKSLGFAGYSGGMSERIMIDALDDEDRRVREAAAIALRKLTPDDALPKLLEKLSDTETVRGYAVTTIGAYGIRAQPYLSLLYSLLESDGVGGTLPQDVRDAIANIENPPAAGTSPVIAVDLNRDGAT